MTRLPLVDGVVLVSYLLGTVALGLWVGLLSTRRADSRPGGPVT